MNSGPTAERVYDALKQRLLDRVFGPGERLDPSRLADELFSSVTPIRDSLHRLAGEGLVETRISDGFHVSSMDAPALQDLYEWNKQILMLALANRDRSISAGTIAMVAGSVPSNTAADVFESIGRASPNFEHLCAIRSLNSRLSAVRRAEIQVLDDVEIEVVAIARFFAVNDKVALQRQIAAYHRRRRSAAPLIVRQYYRPK